MALPSAGTVGVRGGVEGDKGREEVLIWFSQVCDLAAGLVMETSSHETTTASVE